MRVKGWRGWNMTQGFGAWRCYLSIFLKKVGKDKEKDSLELWLNTFFSLSRDIEDFGFALFILPWD